MRWFEIIPPLCFYALAFIWIWQQQFDLFLLSIIAARLYMLKV